MTSIKSTFHVLKRVAICLTLTTLAIPDHSALAQKTPPRGSFSEDRKAKQLLEAGDARMEADEKQRAVELWQEVLNQYPTSKVRYDAHMRIGEHLR